MKFGYHQNGGPDDMDFRILAALQEDSRTPLARIGEAVGLSPPAVLERIKKLEAAGVITGYRALLDGRRLGLDITAFIGVTIEHPRYFDGFTRKILGLSEVLECHRIAGEYSYLLKVKTDNTVSLDRFISELLRTIPGVTRSNTTIVLSSAKETTFVEAGDEKQSKASRSGKAA